MATIGFKGGARARRGAASRLLLVDPYGGSREGLGAALRGGGVLVETADERAEAMAKMEAGEVDLAIVDLDLPPPTASPRTAGTWWTMLRAARPALPLILIAADCEPHTQAEALRLGARLLEKPINPRELRTLVSALRPETAPA